MLLPNRRPRPNRPGPPRRARRLPERWRPGGSPAAWSPAGVREPVDVAPVRTGGRSGRGARGGVGYGRYGLPPSTPSNRDSRTPDTRSAAERCTASRSAGRAGHSGPARDRAPRWPHVRPARTGPRSDPERCAPWPTCAVLAGRRALRALRLLAYGTVHGGPGDERAAPNAILSVRRGGWARRGRGDPGGGRGGRHGDNPAGRGARGTRRRWTGPGTGPRRGRGRGAGYAGHAGLWECVAALGTEQRAVLREAATMHADRHVGSKVYAIFDRQGRGETPIGRTRHPRPRAVW